MNWTKERPHIAGYYWLSEAGRESCIIEIRIENGKCFVFRTGDTRQYPLEVWKKALWCGPLDPC